MAGRVNERDVEITDAHPVARLVGHQRIGAHSGAARDPLHFALLYVHRHVGRLKEIGDAGDVVAHEVTSDVVGVVVRGEHAGHLHSLGFDEFDQFAGPVSRVDQHRLAGFTVADGVDEVDHLRGDGVTDAKVAPGEQLTKVETIAHSPSATRAMRGASSSTRALVVSRRASRDSMIAGARSSLAKSSSTETSPSSKDATIEFSSLAASFQSPVSLIRLHSFR